jgi:hypothetical protein
MPGGTAFSAMPLYCRGLARKRPIGGHGNFIVEVWPAGKDGGRQRYAIVRPTESPRGTHSRQTNV